MINTPESRRKFLKKMGTFAAAAFLPPGSLFLSGCDTINETSFGLINGHVYLNNTYQKKDLVISDGKVAGIGSAESIPSGVDLPVLDCSGLYISPGWVDHHCHIGQIGTSVNRIGPETGVTALVDAGSYGPDTFSLFLDNHYQNAAIPLYVYLNLKHDGITLTNILEKMKPGSEDIQGARSIAEAYPGIVKGFKVRTDNSNACSDDPEYYARLTSRLGDSMGLPVMYHLGDPEPSIDDFLRYSRPGDIITHCLRSSGNCVLDESGRLRQEVDTAIREGVLFDVAHGMSSFSFDSALKALDQGFDDFTISSDIWKLPSISKAVTFANILSKFLSLGMTLEAITERAAVRPRELLSLESVIDGNRTLDLTLFSIKEGHFNYSDTEGVTRSFDKRIIPEYCVIKGKLVEAGGLDKMLI